MKKINFSQFIFADITGKNKQTIDIREQFADIIYRHTTGIVAHALSHKIHESEGEIELTPAEEQLIINVINEFCTPAIIDGVMKQLNRE